jgi:hypothetical protein
MWQPSHSTWRYQRYIKDANLPKNVKSLDGGFEGKNGSEKSF